MALRQAETAVEQFRQKIGLVPQLQQFYEAGCDEWVGDEKESGAMYIGRTYIGYLKCLKAVATLSNADVEKVIEVERLIDEDDAKRAAAAGLEVNKGSAAKFSHGEVLRMLDSEKRKELFDLALAGADPSSAIFAGAVGECTTRLVRGSELVAAGHKPSDKNPLFDNAYIGHTKNLPPRTMVHFIISHYLTRTFQAKYDGDPTLGELAFDKDAMHGLISVGIRLLVAKGKCPPEIVELWNKTRAEGGLQWHNDKYNPNNKQDPKQQFYDKAFGGE
jgi:hypothetical protein